MNSKDDFYDFWGMSIKDYKNHKYKLRPDEFTVLQSLYYYFNNNNMIISGELQSTDGAPECYLFINSIRHAFETTMFNVPIKESDVYFHFKNKCYDFTGLIKKAFEDNLDGQYGIFDFSHDFGALNNNSPVRKDVYEKAVDFISRTSDYSIEYTEEIKSANGMPMFKMRKYRKSIIYKRNEIIPYVRISGHGLKGEDLRKETQKHITNKILKMEKVSPPWILALYDESGFIHSNDFIDISSKLKDTQHFEYIFFIPSLTARNGSSSCLIKTNGDITIF